MREEFCCKDMKEGWLSSCLLEMDEDDEKNPSDHQNSTEHMDPEDIHPVKKGELYLYNDEMSQIECEPFRFCPWCGKSISVTAPQDTNTVTFDGRTIDEV